MHAIRLALRAPDIQIAHKFDHQCLYPLPSDREINPHAAATASIMERERIPLIEDTARSFAHNLAQRLIGHAQDTPMRLQFFQSNFIHYHHLITKLETILPLRQLAHEARAQSTPPYAEYGTDPRLLYLSKRRPITPEDIRDIDPREQERLQALTATRLHESLYRALLSGLHPLLTKLITHQDPVRGYPQEGEISNSEFQMSNSWAHFTCPDCGWNAHHPTGAQARLHHADDRRDCPGSPVIRNSEFQISNS